ncbi:MAG: hypothetical protein ACP5VE_08770 [Chthonomonadales bacterium]
MRVYLAAAAVVVVAAWAIVAIGNLGKPAEVLNAVHHDDAQVPSICPWRDPERDLRAFFGPGVSYSTEILVLSRARAWLVKAIGPTAELPANVLYVRRVRRGDAFVGSIVTGRAPGRFGAVEVVVGVDPKGRIIGVRIQRSREVGASGRLLASGKWLAAFAGKSAQDAFRPGADLPAASPGAEDTARAVSAEIRALLLELYAAERFHTGRLQGGV